LVYGVPYELFWHLNPTKLKPFKIAYQKQLDQKNQLAWIQGQYNLLAIGSVFNGKKCKYPKKPFGKQEDFNDELSGEEKFLLWIEDHNRKYDNGA